MHVLFLDHASHAQTRSADFFTGILEKAGMEVRIWRYARAYRCNTPQDDIAWADVIVIWEFLPFRFSLGFRGKPCIFVPMYDNEWGSGFLWSRIAASGMGVISFCDSLSQHALACGVPAEKLMTVHYFPNPAEYPHDGGVKNSVFLWERGEASEDVARRLFPEGYTFDIKKQDEFQERSAYLKRLSQSQIAIAPRRKEGIGMAFLEAMAMGKCVVANDDATMNEYIVNGESGILFDMRNPAPVPKSAVGKVLSAIDDVARRHFERWEAEKKGVAPFVAGFCGSAPLRSPWRLKSIVWYFLYLAECALMRAKEKLNVI